MLATIAKCMSKYKHKMNDNEYTYWMEFFIDVISDEIEGYIKHQYTRIPSCAPNTFSRFIEKEFNDLMIPLCDRYLGRYSSKERRRAVIETCNKQMQDTTLQSQSSSVMPKILINESANIVHFFE
jgi:hypothetical protein